MKNKLLTARYRDRRRCPRARENRSGCRFQEALRPGRTALLTVCLAVLFVLPGAFAQGTGVVEGRLVNGTDPGIAPGGVSIDVVGLGSGMSVLKSAVTDAAGRFRIDGVPTDQPIMIRADYKSVNYHAQVKFDAGGTAAAEIRVFEPVTSMKDIRVEGVRMGFQMTGERLESLESISFDNRTNPPRTFVNPDGDFRFSKAPGLLEPPRVDVTGPGSTMPLTQSPLESADGKSYYTLYPLRPGITTFEVRQILPYSGKTYEYRKVFYQDVPSVEIGVIPQDVAVSGQGLSRIQSDQQRNFSVYSGGPVKAGSEVVWTFSGGTPVAEPSPAESMAGEAAAGGGVRPYPDVISRNALVLGPLVLMGFVTVLWYAYNHFQSPAQGSGSRIKELRERREQLLSSLAELDSRYEEQGLTRREYQRRREIGKRQLRRIAMLLGNQKPEARSRKSEESRQ